MARTHPSSHRTWRRCILGASAAALGLSLHLGAQDPPATPPAASPPVATAAVPAFRQADHVAVLSVHGEIDQVTLHSLERRIARAVTDGADAIVLDIDTPGGRLDATLDICNLLKDPSETPPNTVAWIHPQAYSAGTIIALACREIVVSPNATFGDAAPIHGIPVVGLIQMAQAERAKIEAPILAEVVDSARRNHYDENLVQAFVSVGIELWLIEHVDTGERIFVDRKEYELAIGEAPPETLTPVAPPKSVAGAASAIAPRINRMLPEREPSADDGLTPEQIKDQIEFQQQLPPTRGPLTESDRGQWRGVAHVITGDRLLTVKKDEAMYFGLAQRSIANDQQLKTFLGAQTLRRYESSWSEGLVRLLISFPVRIILIVVFLISLFIEMAAPGVGVFGAAAAVSLLVLIGAPWLVGMAQWWDILLIVLGIGLIAAEILVIPGLGIAGISGAVCLLAGLVGTFVTGDIASPEGRDELWKGMLSTLSAVFAAGIGIWFLSRHFGTSPLVRRLVLESELRKPGDEEGPGMLTAMGSTSTSPAVDDVGVAATDLRPAGRGTFDGRIVDVQSVGRYIEKGSPIRVISVGRYVIEVEVADS
ncbi:MAG: NfeD family protein [Planctomycetota bacterium]|jgi:membrane-bound ClpP family serine protease